MELDKSNLNFQAKTQELFGENQILLHENNKLIKECNDYKQQRDELIEDIQTQRDLLKEFSKFIDHKLYIHPGNCTYLSYRNELDQLGICKENEWLIWRK